VLKEQSQEIPKNTSKGKEDEKTPVMARGNIINKGESVVVNGMLYTLKDTFELDPYKTFLAIQEKRRSLSTSQTR